MNLLYAIVLGFLNALYCIGVWNAFLPDQIFGSFGDWAAGNKHTGKKRNWPCWITKPLLECPNCLPSIHGSLWWFLFDIGPWYILPFYVVCLSGFLKVVSILVLNQDE